MLILEKYGLESAQFVNKAKSSIVLGDGALRRTQSFEGIELRWKWQLFLFTYLGIPMFNCWPTKGLLQATYDSLKGEMVVLWTGTCDQKKLVVPSMSAMCKPIKEGGLGLRCLRVMNKAAISCKLEAKVSDFISNGKWCLQAIFERLSRMWQNR